jgi:hypothetical protein
MPDAVIIENRPLLARLLLMFWVAEIGVGLLFVLAGANMLRFGENSSLIVLMLILMGLVLVAAGVVMCGLCWQVARLREPAVEMTAEGLLDRRLAPNIIPWEAISWNVIFNGRSYSVQLDIAEPTRSAAGIYWHQRALSLFSRMLRQPAFAVVTLGTGLGAEEIGRRMTAFKPSR